ncbi:uncharacterized protein LOC131879111 isoform X1 [Tigriopus californicus]|nr:uncharacterized protein LOC131879111 isoform X1 [Tigriopus californicus]
MKRTTQYRETTNLLVKDTTKTMDATFKAKDGHKTFNILGIFALVIIFAVTTVFNALAGSLGGKIALFNNSVGNLSDRYETWITPAGWTFSIWSLIYAWLAIMLAFYILSICISNSFGKLYLNPEIVSRCYVVVFAINLLCNLAWIFIWDKEELIAASALLFAIAITNIFVLALLVRNIAADDNWLKGGMPKTYWTYIVLSANSHATYTTWTIVASFLNLYIALFYVGEVEELTCAYISLGSLTGILIIWFMLENFVFDKYVRYIITPYLVVIWAFSGVLSANDQDESIPYEIRAFSRGILGVAIGLFLLRLGSIFYRQKKSPLVGAFEFA